MFKRSFFLTLAVCVLPLFAATPAEDMAKLDQDEGQSFGNNQMVWRLYDAGGSAIAFAVAPTTVYFASGTEVGTIDGTKPGSRKALVPPAGFGADGVVTVAYDGKSAWFGGRDGIAQYAAGKWTVFGADNGLSIGEIRKVRVSDGGDLWCAGSGGVAMYRAGAWKAYTSADGLCSDDVRDIAFDKGGVVWFATAKGLARFDGVKWSKQDMASGMSDNDCHALVVDSRDGDVWVACGEQDVNSFESGTWNTYMDIQKGIRCIMADTQSRIWFGFAGGIIKYNGEEWLNDPKKVGVNASSVHDLYKDKNGDLYFGTEKGVIQLKNPYPY